MIYTSINLLDSYGLLRKVDFRVVGDEFEPKNITNKLLVPSSFEWKKGERYTRLKKQFIKKYSCWGITTDYEESYDISIQILKIIDILSEKKRDLIELKKIYIIDYRIDAIINIENSEIPGIYLDQNIIRFSNDIGSDFDMLYYELIMNCFL